MDAPFNAIVETKAARHKLAAGCTRGMVDAELEREGLSKHLRNEVIVAATNSLNRRGRIKSGFMALGGVVVICIGGLCYCLCVVNQFPAIRLPVLIMMVGLIVTVCGLHGTTQNQI